MKRMKNLSPLALLAIAALVLLAVVPRVAGLDRRPLMHDESLFAYYSWQYFDTMRNNIANHNYFIPYTHIPMLHGPTLMLVTGEIFRHFGDTISHARLMVGLVTLLGMAAAIGLWPRRYRWWFAPLLLTSPILLFYSRFFRDDMLVETANLLATLGIFRAFSARERYLRPFWAVLGAFMVIFPLALMESALFFQASLFTFALVWVANRLFWRGPSSTLRPLPRRPRAYFKLRSDSPETTKSGRKRRKDLPKPQAAASTALAEPAPPPAEAPIPAPDPLADPVRRGSSIWGLLPGWLVGAVLGVVMVLFVYGITFNPASPPSDVPNSFTIYKNTSPAMKPLMGSLLNLAASWNYWKGQHEEHRIEGAIHYHLVILVVYELPILLLIAAGLILDAAQRKRRAAFYGIGWAAWVLIWALWRIPSYASYFTFFDPAKNPYAPPEGRLKNLTGFLHVEPNVSMLILGLLIVPLLVWSVMMLREHRPLPAWLGWWGACSLFQYSSAGEKVPWLAMHIAVPLILAAGWIWAPRLRRLSRGTGGSPVISESSRGTGVSPVISESNGTGILPLIPASIPLRAMIGVLVVATLIGARNDYRLLDPFKTQGIREFECLGVKEQLSRQGADPRERLVYNHTPAEFDRLALQHIEAWKANSKHIPLKLRNVWLIDAPGWPGVWYYRDCAVHQTPTAPLTIAPDTDLMLGNKELMEKLAATLDRAKWRVTELSLRDHWWAPWPEEDFGKENMTWPQIFGQWCNYYWTRTPWTEPGGFTLIAIEPIKMRE